MFITVTTLNNWIYVYGHDWTSIWGKMNSPGFPLINLKSSCPWEYVADANGVMKVQLLPFAIPNCIDLVNSNRTHYVPNLKGVCSPIQLSSNCHLSGGPIVGFTCIYAVSFPTEKRNDQGTPFVNNSTVVPASTIKPTSIQPITTQYEKETSKKNPITDKKPDDKDKDIEPPAEEKQEQHDKYTTRLHQYFAPPFLNNGEFIQPSYLRDNSAQFQPPFLNGMGVQMGEPPAVPPFVMNTNENPTETNRNVNVDEKDQTGNVDEHEVTDMAEKSNP